MSSLVIVREINLIDSSLIKSHRFYLAGFDENGFYQQSVSFSAFFHGMKKRNYNKDILFLGKTGVELTLYGLEFIDKNKPIIDHSDIWNFYKYIGYNHKKNKYEFS